jgi:hypothetical protein
MKLVIEVTAKHVYRLESPECGLRTHVYLKVKALQHEARSREFYGLELRLPALTDEEAAEFQVGKEYLFHAEAERDAL